MKYQAVNYILEQLDAEKDAAEAHGLAAGMLCVEIRADVSNWLDELLPEPIELEDEDKIELLDVFERTRQLLNAEHNEFSFDLLMPDDDQPLVDQVEALRNWCLGFLFGVGYAQTSGEWPGESGEIMRDLIEITKIDADSEDEDDENALVEIREYVRAAVFLIRDQFAEKAATQQH